MQIKCASDARRSAVRNDLNINGIDYLEVLTVQSESNGFYPNPLLVVHCFKTASGLDKDNIAIQGGVRIKNVEAVWAHLGAELDKPGIKDKISLPEHMALERIKDQDTTLVVRASSQGDFSTYVLAVVRSASRPDVPGSRL